MAYYKQYFEGAEVEKFKLSMLNWADRFSIFCFLDSHHYEPDTSGYAWLLAAGAHRKIKVPEEQAFSFLKDSYAHANGWWFGHIGFGLQESFFPGQASPDEYISFGQSVFFEPLYILSCQDERLCIESLEDDCENIFQQISSFSIPFLLKKNAPVQTEAGMTKSEYLAAVKAIRQHIIRGDCYELNFCQEFTASGYEAEPLNIFNNLSRLSPNPFAALYKLGDKYCICESPERYLKKEGDKISSSPIKGTSRRYPEDEKKDEESRRALLSSAKDKSENVMVVDLVRNDLSKVCREGTVQVEELFKLKSFPAIHHLVSTVSGNLVEGLNWIDAVEASFPMGSMTGAPKKKVLELIRKFEATGRGLFSGTIGFIKPNGDCDFNVVIRSILIDKKKKTLSFWAGSGITFYSDPEAEYEECLLKAAAIQAVLNKAS